MRPDFDDILELYRSGYPFAEFGGKQMVELLESCAGFLDTGEFSFETSHTTLWIVHRLHANEDVGDLHRALGVGAYDDTFQLLWSFNTHLDVEQSEILDLRLTQAETKEKLEYYSAELIRLADPSTG